MTCPHCHVLLKRKERGGSTCDSCRKEFAFDPKDHPLGLNDLRFRRVADHLGAGGAKYTAAQLRVALTRQKAKSMRERLTGAIVLGSLGLVCTVFALWVRAGGSSVGLGVFMMLAGAVMASTAHYNSSVAMTDSRFQIEVLDRWRAVYGELPAGLIEEAFLSGLGEAERPLDCLLAVVVCPERDVLASLLANGVPRELRLGLLSTAPPTDAWEQALLARLQRNPRRPILLLHDASAEGVVLARDLPRLLGLDAGHRILDLGLNPKKSIAKNRTITSRPVSPEIRARLDHEAMGADVAGSRPIRRGRAQVTAEELAWLKEGNCSPILAVPPASLVKRLKFALGKLSPRRESTPPEAGALASAGFLSWPAPPS